MKNKKLCLLTSLSIATVGLIVGVLVGTGGNSTLGIGSVECNHTHLNHYDAYAPTKDAIGKNREYYICCDCHKMFAESTCVTEITESIDLAKKTTGSKISVGDLGGKSVASLYQGTDKLKCFDQTDWSAYPGGKGTGTVSYYEMDAVKGHPGKKALFLSADLNAEQKAARDANNSGFSECRFLVNCGSTVTFDYKYYDLNDEIRVAGEKHTFVQSYNGSTYVEAPCDLINDNQWHTITVTCATQDFQYMVLKLYHFTGEIYLANMSVGGTATVGFSVEEPLMPTGNLMEYVAYSNEGEPILFEATELVYPNAVITPFASVTKAKGGSEDRYLHLKTTLKGIRSITVTGKGSVYVFPSKIAWTWNKDAGVLLNLNSTRVEYKFDEYETNYLHFYAPTDFVLYSLQFDITGVEATGHTKVDDDILSTAYTDISGFWAGAYNTTGYDVGVENHITNNSNTAYRFAQLIKPDVDPWYPTALVLGTPLSVTPGQAIEFDAKLVSGRDWFSIKLFNTNTQTFCKCDWNGNPAAEEIGFNPTTEWKTYKILINDTFTVTHIIFTMNAKTNNTDIWNEIVLDNMYVNEHPNAVLEKTTVATSWAYRAFSKTIAESDYLFKAIAFDFKMTADGTIELPIMSDPNHYIGGPNNITKSGDNYTTTYGQIVKGKDGWVTLVVSESNLCFSDNGRAAYSSTIGGIYIARNSALGVDTYFDYTSIRVVDWVAPTRATTAIVVQGGFQPWGTDITAVPTADGFNTQGKNIAIAIDFYLDGEDGSSLVFNLADSGNSMMYAGVTITKESGVLTTNVGTLVPHADGWVTLVIKNSEVTAPVTGYVNVYWVTGCTFTTANYDNFSIRLMTY